MNRFQILNMDGSDDTREDDDHDSSRMAFPTTMTTSIAGVVA